MPTVGKLDKRTQRKSGKRSLKLRRLHLAREKYQEELQKQKELKSNISLCSVSKVVEEAPHIKQNLSTARQISSVQTYNGHQKDPVPTTSENPIITNLISSVPKVHTYSPQIPVSSVAVESSSTVQQTFSKHPNYPVLGIPEDTDSIEIVSVASQYTNSSQLPTSSVAVKDKYVLPFAKDSVESSNTTQAVPNDDSLPSISSTGTSTLPVISNSVPDSLPKISSNDCSSSSVVSISDDCSSSSVVSTSDESTSEEVLCTHRSIATQTNFRKSVPHRSVGTQMNFHALKTPKKIFKYRRRFAKTLERLPKAVRVKGRRIVDFQYFFKAIKAVNNHSKDRNNHSEAGCNLNNIFIKREKKHGIRTSYFLKCAVCNFKKKIWSENPKSIKKNLNNDFLSGMLSIKCGFQEANVLLSKLRLPLLKPNDFVKEYEKVCKSSNVGNNKTNQDISDNLEKNLQTEPQLSAMLECSSESDNSNFLEHVDLSGLLVDDQLEITEENIIENKNEPETIYLDQGMTTSDDKLISSQEHLITNNNKTSQGASKNSGENKQREPQLTAVQQCSSASGSSSLFEQVDLDDLIVEDQFEIKEENIIENKNETETIIPDQRVRTSDCKLIVGQEQVIAHSNKTFQNTSKNLVENVKNIIENKNEPENIIIAQRVRTSDDKMITDQEQVILNVTTIKQEINPDDEDVTSSVANETKSQESKIDNYEQSVFRAEPILSHQNEERACEKRMIVNQEQINFQNVIANKNEPENIILGQRMIISDDKFIVDQERLILNMTTIKQEINSDDEDPTSSVINETKSKESKIDNYEQSVFRAEPILSHQNEERACEKRMIVNQEQINFQNVIANKNEPENIILGQRMIISDDKFIVDQERLILNMTTIKQEINSDDEDPTSSVINETKSKESKIDNYEQSIFRAVPIFSQQNEERACDKRMIVNQEQINLHKNVIINNQVKNILVKPDVNTVEIINEDSMTEFDYNSESELPCKKARTEIYKDSNNPACMQRIPRKTLSKEINNFQSRFESNVFVTVTSTTTTEENVASTSSITSGEILTAVSSISGKNLTATSSVTSEEILTAVSSMTNGENLTATSSITSEETLTAISSITSGENLTGTSSITSGENLTGTPSITTQGGDINFLIPVQHLSKSNENDALGVPQMSHYRTSETCENKTISSITSGENLTRTSSITNAENLTRTPSITTQGGDITFLIPVQHLPKSNENDALGVPQMPHYMASETCESKTLSSITSGENLTGTSSITNGKNLTGTPSITTQGGDITFLIPVQRLPKSNENDALGVPQMSHYMTNETCESKTISSITSGENLTGTSSVTNGENVTGTPSITTQGGDITFLIPVQHLPKSNENDALGVPQMPYYMASETCEGLSGTACISGVPSTIQQPANPSAEMYTLLAPNVVQQPVNSSNNMPGVIPNAIWQHTSSSGILNANGVTYVSFAPTVFQQLVNSSNSTPGVVPAAIWQPTSLSDTVPKTIGSNICVQQPVKSSNTIPEEIPAAIRKRKLSRYSTNSDEVRYVPAPAVAQQPTNNSNAIQNAVQKLYKLLRED